jgi:tetratricopeptide (TPR) repeat protein
MRSILVLLTALVACTAAGGDVFPQQFTPPARRGTAVSIPGAPLPPVDPDAIRTFIGPYATGLKLLRLTLGEGPALARGYGFLATLYAALDEMPQAERYFSDALRILQKNGGPRDLGWVHNNRGLVQMGEGEYAAAIRSFRTAARLFDPLRPDLRLFHVAALGNLGSAYSLNGDEEHAEEALLGALEQLKHLPASGDTRSSGQMTRINLATTYISAGDYAAAKATLEPLAAEASLPSALRFAILNDLGSALSQLREFPEAERRLRDSLAITKEGSASRGQALMNLASMYGNARRYEDADRCARQAAALMATLYGEQSRTAAAVRVSLALTALSRGELETADTILTANLPVLAKSPGDLSVYVTATRELALVAQLRGQPQRAQALSRQALDLAQQQLDRLLAFGSEAQRLAYLASSAPYDQLGNLGNPTLLASAALRNKGAVLESLLAERALVRRGTALADRESLDRIHELKVHIMEKIARGDADPDDDTAALRREETALAKRLAPALARERNGVSLAAAQAALVPGQVLVEIVRYQRYAGAGNLVDAYGAVVIRREGPPAWTPLGDCNDTDRRINAVVRAFNRGGRGGEVPGGGSDAAEHLRSLHAQLWAPIEHLFPEGTTSVLMSPDGVTAFLPWGALLGDGDKFVAERFAVIEAGSGHDLVERVAPLTTGTLLIAADAAGNLPYSRDEAKKIDAVAHAHGWKTTLLLGDAATEPAIARSASPRILHLSTHGGQLPATGAAASQRLRDNPMYRGYVLLGGGAATLRAWQQGGTLPFGEDGVLTAEEAGGLDLGDTWLTVLSACGTGEGAARDSEGVLGLRRGFRLAGTKNLIVTLWSVRDDSTAAFMKHFYERLFDTGDLARSFAETQRAELQHWKETSHDVTEAAYRAGAFVLSR